MSINIDYHVRLKASQIKYDLNSKVTIIGKILFIAQDEFKGGGGVYTFMLHHGGGTIAAKLYYRLNNIENHYNVNNFVKDDVVMVHGHLKQIKYKDKDLNIVDKGHVLIVTPFGIRYYTPYLNKMAEIAHPVVETLTTDIKIKRLSFILEIADKQFFNPSGYGQIPQDYIDYINKIKLEYKKLLNK